MKKQYILSFDQGTSSSRTILYNLDRQVLGMESIELRSIYPESGWVEQDPMEILNSQIASASLLLIRLNIKVDEVIACGITNQRETTVVWDKLSGKPIYNAIVWQDTRTSEYCQNLRKDGLEEVIQSKTGLMLDSYFSATKINWILNNVARAKHKAEKGELLFGTIDTWLLWNLTDGSHLTDFSNASRTMLFNLKDERWDRELLNLFNIPASMLPDVIETSDDFGRIKPDILGGEIPVNAMVGDQQAALYGQNCFKPGEVKNTYGTGCFMLMNTGKKLVSSTHGLISTIAWKIDGQIVYALEGSIFIGGALIQWLRDELGIIDDAASSEKMAKSLEDTNGVYIVPAFTGLGAPHWDMTARGAITGLTRGSNKMHITRAALEAIAYQTKDVLNAMIKDSGLLLNALKVDGGASQNNFLMQFQADILNVRVFRPKSVESTAMGAALLAGLKAGCWKTSGLEDQGNGSQVFLPTMKDKERRSGYDGWINAVNLIKNQ
jgi:glycerol kinase